MSNNQNYCNYYM